MQHKYIRTLRAPVTGDSQELRVSDMISDLCLCLLPGFLFSTSFMTIVNDVPSAVVILSSFEGDFRRKSSSEIEEAGTDFFGPRPPN